MTALAQKSFIFSVFLYGASLPFSMAATNFSLALLALAIAVMLLSHETHWTLPPSLFWLALFFFWAMVTGMISNRRISFSSFDAFSKIWNVLPYILIPMGSSLLVGRSEKILKTVLGAGVVVVIFGAVQFWGNIPYFFEGSLIQHSLVEQKRFYGFQSHPLHAGALYSILFLTALAATLFYDRGAKYFGMGLCASALMCLGVILTGSRSYYLGIVAGSLLLLILRGWKFFLTGAFALGLFALILFKTNPYIENRMRTVSISHMDESSSQRFYIWKSAGLMILDRPLAGVGYHNWKSFLPSYAKAMPDWTMTDAALSHAHNSVLTVTAETGFLGLGIFLGFWIVLVREQLIVFRAARKESLQYALSLGVLSIFPCLFIASLTEHNLLTATLSLAFFFMAGLARVEER